MKKWIDHEKTFVKDGLISKDQYARLVRAAGGSQADSLAGSHARHRQDADRDQLTITNCCA